MNHLDTQFFEIATIAMQCIALFFVLLGIVLRVRKRIPKKKTASIQRPVDVHGLKTVTTGSYYQLSGTFSAKLIDDSEELKTDFAELSADEQASFEMEMRMFYAIQAKAATLETRNARDTKHINHSNSNTWAPA